MELGRSAKEKSDAGACADDPTLLSVLIERSLQWAESADEKLVAASCDGPGRGLRMGTLSDAPDLKGDLIGDDVVFLKREVVVGVCDFDDFVSILPWCSVSPSSDADGRLAGIERFACLKKSAISRC